MDDADFRALCKRAIAIHTSFSKAPADADAEKLYLRAVLGMEVLFKAIERLIPAADSAIKYQELLYAVATNIPGQSRHETALKYIQRCEHSLADAPITLSRADAKLFLYGGKMSELGEAEMRLKAALLTNTEAGSNDGSKDR